MLASTEYRSLACMGFPNLEINLKEEIRDIFSKQNILPSSTGYYTLPTPSGPMTYNSNRLLGEAWWTADPSSYKSDGTFLGEHVEEIIRNAAYFHTLGINDRKPFLYAPLYGDELWVLDCGKIIDIDVWLVTDDPECLNINEKMDFIVAVMFIPIPCWLSSKGYSYRDLVVIHKDGNLNNNASYNLAWSLPLKDEMLEEIANGTTIEPKPKRTRRSIEEILLDQIFHMLSLGLTNQMISRLLDISPENINNVRHKRSKGYTTSKLKWPELNPKQDPAYALPIEDREKVLKQYNITHDLFRIEKITGIPLKQIIPILETFTDWWKAYIGNGIDKPYRDKIIYALYDRKDFETYSDIEDLLLVSPGTVAGVIYRHQLEQQGIKRSHSAKSK